MTTAMPGTPLPEPPPPVVTAAPGSPLATLLDRRDALKAQADEFTAQVKALTAEIENALALALASPDGKIPAKIDIDSPGRNRLRMSWRYSSRLNADAFKAEQPTAFAIYRHYVRVGKGYWDLRALGSRG